MSKKLKKEPSCVLYLALFGKKRRNVFFNISKAKVNVMGIKVLIMGINVTYRHNRETQCH